VNKTDTSDPTRDAGTIAVLVAIAMVPIVGLFAVVVDAGRVIAERQQLQTAVEAAALAGAIDRRAGISACSSATTRVENTVGTSPTVTCSTTGTATGGTVTVSASTTSNLSLGALFGRSSAAITTTAGARSGGATSVTGVRPLSICAEHPALLAWLASGLTDTATYSIGIESDGTSCGGNIAGNWGVLDLDGGSNSMAITQEWISNGYGGELSVPSVIGGDPGIPSPAFDLTDIIDKSIVVPIFANATGTGQNAQYSVVGFVGIVIEGATLNGPASERHVLLRFTTDTGTATTSGCCTKDAEINAGITAARLCNLDGIGDC